MAEKVTTNLYDFAMSLEGMAPAQREFNERMQKLAAERLSAEAKWLDEGIAALIRAGAPIERITVEFWPQGKGDISTPFSRVVVRNADGGKAVAAELRRLAESENIPWQATSLEREPSCGDLREAVQEWLRKRADELDPDYGPCRSCGRTGEGIVCDQCEDDERQSP